MYQRCHYHTQSDASSTYPEPPASLRLRVGVHPGTPVFESVEVTQDYIQFRQESRTQYEEMMRNPQHDHDEWLDWDELRPQHRLRQRGERRQDSLMSNAGQRLSPTQNATAIRQETRDRNRCAHQVRQPQLLRLSGPYAVLQEDVAVKTELPVVSQTHLSIASANGTLDPDEITPQPRVVREDPNVHYPMRPGGINDRRVLFRPPEPRSPLNEGTLASVHLHTESTLEELDKARREHAEFLRKRAEANPPPPKLSMFRRVKERVKERASQFSLDDLLIKLQLKVKDEKTGTFGLLANDDPRKIPDHIMPKKPLIYLTSPNDVQDARYRARYDVHWDDDTGRYIRCPEHWLRAKNRTSHFSDTINYDGNVDVAAFKQRDENSALAGDFELHTQKYPLAKHWKQWIRQQRDEHLDRLDEVLDEVYTATRNQGRIALVHILSRLRKKIGADRFEYLVLKYVGDERYKRIMGHNSSPDLGREGFESSGIDPKTGLPKFLVFQEESELDFGAYE